MSVLLHVEAFCFVTLRQWPCTSSLTKSTSASHQLVRFPPTGRPHAPANAGTSPHVKPRCSGSVGVYCGGKMLACYT